MEIFLSILWILWPPISWTLWRRSEGRRLHWLIVLPAVTFVGSLLLFFSQIDIPVARTQGDRMVDSLFTLMVLPVTFVWVGVIYFIGFASVERKQGPSPQD